MKKGRLRSVFMSRANSYLKLELHVCNVGRHIADDEKHCYSNWKPGHGLLVQCPAAEEEVPRAPRPTFFLLHFTAPWRLAACRRCRAHILTNFACARCYRQFLLPASAPLAPCWVGFLRIFRNSLSIKEIVIQYKTLVDSYLSLKQGFLSQYNFHN